MEHQSLYRKYRPKDFDEVVGQTAVVHALSTAVAQKKVAHAYVFSGGRGIGKTSIARILAKALGVTEKDVYEIDAASHTGVDDIRALREGAATLPMESPYKVYILDEAHMLSKSAFNALLKTLEEPPAHVIFILATTEIEKIPDTVLSRCEVYTLERPNRTVLSDVVSRIAKKEGYSIPGEAADVIGMLGDGSYRDTLSLLQQVITASEGKKITLQTVEQVTGAPSYTLVQSVLTALTKGSPQAVLGELGNIRARHINVPVFSQLLVDTIRAVLVMRLAPDLKASLEGQFSPDALAYIIERAKDTQAVIAINSKMLLTFLELGKDIAHAPDPFVYIEVACIQLLEKNTQNV